MKNIHAVGVIFENLKGEILVLKRSSDSIEGEMWGLVGGHIDQNEDKYQAAVREIKEEIGLEADVDQLQFLKTFHWERPEMKLDFETFKYLADKNLTISLDKEENTTFMWAPPKDLYGREDLMMGLYPILEDEYQV